jgi:hypothetical protein
LALPKAAQLVVRVMVGHDFLHCESARRESP